MDSHSNGVSPSPAASPELRTEVGRAAEALEWAELTADSGDFPMAVKWLDYAETLLGKLTPRYDERRRTWAVAAANGGN